MSISQKRRRILYVLQPGGGGAATSLYDLVLGLDKDRYEPYVLFYQPDYYCDKFEAAGAKILILSENYPLFERTLHYYSTDDIREKYGKFVWKLYWLAHVIYLTIQVIILLKRYRIDLVHNNDNLMMDRFTVLAAKLAGIKQVCHVRSCGDLSSRFRQKMADAVNTFIYVSRHVEKYYLHEGIPPEKGQVAYEGFELAPFQQVTEAQIQELRQELGVGDNEVLVSNLGRIVKCKGQDYFLEAIARVVQEQPHVKALVVGDYGYGYSNEEKNYSQRLKQIIADGNIEQNVIFTGFRADTAAIMSASDIIVHASSEPEPFGRVPIEGMLAGRPVVATAIGGPCETVDDHETGLLVPAKNADAMADAILELIEDPNLARAIGKKAQLYAQERFSVAQHVQAVQDIYESVLSNTGK